MANVCAYFEYQKTKNMRRLNYLLGVIITFLATGCEIINSSQKNCFAFQSNEGGKWGLIGLDGEILFENEFDSIPSYANGMFFVQNENDLFDLYTASKEPILIGNDYPMSGIGRFSRNGIAAVSRQNKPIEIIDRQGNVKLLLDTIDGHVVTSIFPFNKNGLARFKIGDLQGCLNEQGNIIVKPEYWLLGVAYHNIVGLSYKYIDDYKEKESEKLVWDIFDLNGNQIGEIENALSLIGTPKVNRFIKGSYEINEKDYSSHPVFTLIDEKGNSICKTKILHLNSFSKGRDLFCYKDGKNWGVMDFDGNVILKPKYDYLSFVSDKVLCVTNDGEGKNRRLINLNGENISNTRFFDVSDFTNGTALAEVEKHKWVLIDEEGNVKKDLPAVYQVGHLDVRKTYNNCIDMDTYLESLNITENGIDGISFESEWYPITLYADRAQDEQFGKAQSSISVYWGAPQETTYTKYSNDVITRFRIVFPSQGFYTEEYGNGKPLHPKVFFIYTPAKDQMKFNLDKLYKAYCSKVSKFGYLVESNENVMVVQGAGVCYSVWKTKSYVAFSMGKVLPDFYDISQFEDNEQ